MSNHFFIPQYRFSKSQAGFMKFGNASFHSDEKAEFAPVLEGHRDKKP